MMWVHVGRMHWKCKDYKEGFTLKVKQNKNKFDWSVKHGDAKIKTGTEVNALDAMNKAQFEAKIYNN